ncbi:MAG: hypothetical protein ACI9MC_003129 [Kiritimatiellia bacterium]
MERLTSLNSATVALAARTRSWSVPWSRLFPVWRHAVWLTALFIVLAVAVAIRLDVQRLHMDLDRNDRVHRSAGVLHERLVLEMDARTRLETMQGYADTLGADVHAPLIVVLEEHP